MKSTRERGPRTLRHLYVPLDENRIEQLRRLAVAEKRDPRKQAAVLLERELDRLVDEAGNRRLTEEAR
jgi:hypothetical protein